MRCMKPRLSALYQSACKECEAAGVDLSPEDYAWLYDASRRVIDDGNECPALLQVPVSIGNVTLYPRTIGASLWWDNYGEKWYGTASKEQHVVALAWMLAHSHDSGLFSRLESKWKADAAILAWSVKVAARITPADLAWGVDRLFGQVDYVETDDGIRREDSPGAADWGAAIARLCAAYGRRPEYFLWEIDETLCATLLKNAPLPNGTQPGADADASRRLAEFREIVRTIKAKAPKAVKDNNNG